MKMLFLLSTFVLSLITAQYVSAQSDTVANWKLDELSGDIIFDESSYHNDGTAYGTSIIPGVFKNARGFNGINDYIYVNDPSDGSLDFDSSESFTIELWFRTVSSAAYQEVLRKGVAPIPGYLIEIKNGYVYGVIGSNEYGHLPDSMLIVKSDSQWNDGMWHHVVFIRDKSLNNLYLYIDNQLATQPVRDQPLLPLKNNRPLTIGRWENPTYPCYYFGSLDEILIRKGTYYPISISGNKYDDQNGNGIHDTGEPGIENWKIILSGVASETTYTNKSGFYVFTHADTGLFTISEEIKPDWTPINPVEGVYEGIQIKTDTNITGIDFGNFHLGTISGQKFKDLNRNGEKDIDEPGIINWKIKLTGTLDDSTFTDEDGNYSFSSLPIGTYTVSEDAKQGWEQTFPTGLSTHEITISSSGQEFIDIDFGNAVTIPKVKLPLSFYNADKSAVRDIYWGIRSGAATGIWGIDPSATSADSLEGESDLPPPISGTFDVRFVNPDHSPNYFGQGSWVDVRNFVSSTQSDTYKVSFQPGPVGYPATFKWSKELVNQSFGGIVRIGKNPGNWVNMKVEDSLVVTNVNTSSIYIISENPTIPILYNKGWNMVSLPMMVEDARRNTLFPTAISNCYCYDHVLGYGVSDTLVTGKGYWVKFSGVVPPMALEGMDVYSDTVNVFSGWNMIGSLTNPVSVNTIESIPSGIIIGDFYGYDGSYYSTDTLKPFMGYWVKVSEDGQLVLSSPIK